MLTVPSGAEKYSTQLPSVKAMQTYTHGASWKIIIAQRGWKAGFVRVRDEMYSFEEEQPNVFMSARTPSQLVTTEERLTRIGL